MAQTLMDLIAKVKPRLKRVFAVALGAATLGLAGGGAQAACEYDKIERFLSSQAFKLAAEDKIGLYARTVHRYFGKSELSREQVLDRMIAWERRWPDRIYQFMRITDFEETDARDACRVRFTYKFIAYSPERDKTSAGIGRSTLVIAERGPDRTLKIVGEWGDVMCRGLSRFVHNAC